MSFLTPVLGQYEEVVLGNEYVKTSAFSLNRILLNVVFVLVYNCYSKEYRNTLYVKLFYLSVIIYNLLAFSGVANRIALYFSIAQVLAFVNFKYVSKSNKWLFSTVTIIYALSYYILTLINNRGRIIPYEVAKYYENSTSIYLVILYGLLTVILVYILEHYLGLARFKNNKLNL